LIDIMADPTPISFSILALRLFSELEHKKAAFDRPERFFYAGGTRLLLDAGPAS
jgi:hypothetical protein